MILLNGEPVSTTPFDHPHGRPTDLFLRMDGVVVNPGDDVTWSGDMPDGKTHIWVRFDFRTYSGDLSEGNLCLLK
ncbi:MAG: hypothetical protein EBT79_06455 [Actinobacteria bacterium]|nr:hypothetical protein [Actinomycetota bacterium]NBR66910.1 hypothetical protein [Actinomycetota bacterium]